jgi:hypothetical protein
MALTGNVESLLIQEVRNGGFSLIRLILNKSNTFTDSVENRDQKLSRVVAFRISQGDYDDLAALARSRKQSITKIIVETIGYEIEHYRKYFKK